MKKVFFLLLLFLLSCKNKNIKYDYPVDNKTNKINKTGKIFGNKTEFNFNKKEEIISNDKNIFEKSLFIVSNILPISILNENNGIIITEWGKIKKIDNINQYKITICINKKDLNNEYDFKKINISIFKKDNKNIVSKDLEIEKKIKEIFKNSQYGS